MKRTTPEVNKWLKEEYPAIKKRAAKLKAEIHWEDETGMRSDHQAGTTWAPRGQNTRSFLYRETVSHEYDFQYYQSGQSCF